jgi:hypothetical protein
MTRARVQATDDNYDDMFAAANGLEPAGKQACAGEARASAHLVRIGQGVCDAPAIFRKQVRMPFGYVPFPFVG